MMFHHDGRTYTQAATAAAQEAKAKMERIIEAGRGSAQKVLETIHNRKIEDRIVAGKALKFDYVELGQAQGLMDGDLPAAVAAVLNQPQPVGELLVHMGEHGAGIHQNALNQAAGRAGVPFKYLNALLSSPYAALRDLALRILNTHYHDALPEERFLARCVKGELRGLMSDRYRRLDSKVILDALAVACADVGAVPADGAVSDLRVGLKAYLPVIFEPIPNEPMLVGLQWQNSDFGVGAHTLTQTLMRIWCTNKATTENGIRDIHLGRKLPDDIAFSERTYQLDTAATASAVGDTVRDLFSPAKVDALMAKIKVANDISVDWKDFAKKLKNLSAVEISKAGDAFTSDDVINLPPGNTLWRASNAISWIAGQTENVDRRLDLEHVAGELLNPLEVPDHLMPTPVIAYS